MSTFAPPARRGDFLYSSVLHADPGNGNQHARASVAELAALLRPETLKLYSNGRKPEGATPAKDPVWHFYSSQLIHYGLPVTKDQNAAKVRLLNAMNQFKLEVPAWVLKLEGELKKEWEAENRKLKKGAGAKSSTRVKSNNARAQGIGGTLSAKTGVNVTVNLTLSPALSMTDQMGYQQVGNNTPKRPSPVKRKRADSDVPSPANIPKKVARVKKVPTTEPFSIKKGLAPKRSGSGVKQEYRTSAAVSTPPRSRVKQEQNYSPPPYPSYTSSPHIKPDPYASSPYQPQSSILLTGSYEIDCQAATDMFGNVKMDLTLSLDSARGIWWATFCWGVWDGIIQMNPDPTGSIGQPCALGWRLRDLETGKLTFGRKCTGSMTFFKEQYFRGCLFEVPGVGAVEFNGQRVLGAGLEDDLQHDWDAFVTEAYRR
ncbi:hypothetical protein EJ02DRAFT_365939 [Clathrospora elynae]|uniref:Uncharacterized protein n=1 Tax=Clathrospora elynae TaxID=706981 RepID=A0A6A5T361_9PLEO|nr:hypothetical protein EJ02DRAFT_365939 [Clathrospora elynae]